MANQFVVELKNEPGALAILAEALATRGIDLRAIGGGGIGDSGHIIMRQQIADLADTHHRNQRPTAQTTNVVLPPEAALMLPAPRGAARAPGRPRAKPAR